MRISGLQVGIKRKTRNPSNGDRGIEEKVRIT
jgi:hypothetical protein